MHRPNKLTLAVIILLVANISAPFILISNLNVATPKIKNDYEERIKKMEDNFPDEINALENKYTQEIGGVDSDRLKEETKAYYAKIWQERRNYNSRYALTPREKARLEMFALAKDKTKTIDGIVRGIAIKAAPKNSEVRVYTTRTGIRLDIDFNMSELTSGEKGTRTKHLTIESLKKEVVRLISKVTNDVYEFCQDLDLDTIAIGCKHFVGFDYKSGSSVDKNIILYKIRIDKRDIGKLKHNPFLDIYSTTKYFKVEDDSFPILNIKQVNL